MARSGEVSEPFITGDWVINCASGIVEMNSKLWWPSCAGRRRYLLTSRILELLLGGVLGLCDDFGGFHAAPKSD